jgi:hypothetical protein
MVDHAVDAGCVDRPVGEKRRGRDGKDAFGVDRKHENPPWLEWITTMMKDGLRLWQAQANGDSLACLS